METEWSSDGLMFVTVAPSCRLPVNTERGVARIASSAADRQHITNNIQLLRDLFSPHKYEQYLQ